MSSNPVIGSIERDIERTPAGYPAMPGYQPGHQGAGSYSNYQPAVRMETTAGQTPMGEFEQAYMGRSADGVDTGRMTYDDVIVKTGTMFGLLLVGAFVGWFGIRVNPAAATAILFTSMIVSLVLAMVNIFSKTVRPGLIIAYAVAEGVMLGALSFVFEYIYPGIVLQAVIATFVVMGVALALFTSGKVRYTSKVNKIVLIGLFSVLGYNLVNLILVWTNVLDTPFGLGSMSILGIPLGLIVGAIAIIIGTLSLIGDFDVAKRGVEAGVPAVFSWRVAFGITVTAVWIYVEVLRFLAILRSVVGGD